MKKAADMLNGLPDGSEFVTGRLDELIREGLKGSGSPDHCTRCGHRLGEHDVGTCSTCNWEDWQNEYRCEDKDIL